MINRGDLMMVAILECITHTRDTDLIEPENASRTRENDPGEARICCGSFENQRHQDHCPRVLSLNNSFSKDKERWEDNYINRNTQKLRQAVIVEEDHARVIQEQINNLVLPPLFPNSRRQLPYEGTY